MSDFTEDDWQAIVLLEQESMMPGAHVSRRWATFPQQADPERVFFYPDIHFKFHDKLFLAYLDAKCFEFNPTTIVIIGDLLDCYSISNFDKDPARKDTLNDERNAAREWLRQLRSSHPQAEIIFIEGNHEERLRRNLRRYLPGLHDLPELTIPALLSLDKLNIKHCSSYGFKRWGMRIKHGESTAKYSSSAEMMKHRTSGISGHVHRDQVAQFTDGEGHTTIWRSLGHCCNMDYVEYGVGLNWNLGGGQLTVYPNGEQVWLSLLG